MRKPAWIGITLVTLAWPVCLAAQQPPPAQTVAEAARKARQARKDQPENKKVYTNDNIASVKGDVNVVGPPPPPPAKDGPEESKAAAPAAKQPAPKDEKEEKGEAYWRKRFAAARQKLQLAEKEADIMQRELNLLQTQYYSDPTKAMNEQLDRKEINEKQQKLDAKKKEVEDLRQGLTDLEAELRRAGGDPGWAREQ
jgi:hypothetical protein